MNDLLKEIAVRSQIPGLERELRSSLRGELGGLATKAGLSEQRLMERVREGAREILESVESAWIDRETALREKRQLAHRRSFPQNLRHYALIWMIPFNGVVIFFGVEAMAWALSFEGFIAFLSLLFALGAGVVAARLTFLAWYRMQEPNRRLVDEEFEAASRQYRKALAVSVRGWLTEQVNAATGLSYGTSLNYTSCSGLAEVDDSAREVSTSAQSRLLELIERMPGGAIGLSGSRGAGKTTLMRSLCRSTDDEILTVMVDAPVSYDARDFVLYLFAQTCSRVLGSEGVARLRGGVGSSSPQVLMFGSQRGTAGLALFVIGAIFAFSGWFTSLSSQAIWGIALVGAGYVLVLTGMLEMSQRRRRARGAARDLVLEHSDAPDAQTAATRLRQIWFQQSFTSGWSGALKTPIGVEGGLSGNTELAEQQLTFPEIVSLFKAFLEQVASSRQVRIGIDELDKMDDETARCFLNEIKVVFRVPGCFFFISISEDAMSFFERRGLPFRDVFDSSFDDVVHIPNMPFVASRELLDRRIVDLPLPFACLLHAISGGLPRDLIRAARDLVELDKGISLERAAADLLGDALGSKASAARIAARRFQLENHVALLVDLVERLECESADSRALLVICEEFESTFLDGLAGLPDQEDLRRERRELQGLGTQLVTFAYHEATMLEVFTRFEWSRYVDDAIDDTAENGQSLVDRLANATEVFATADINTVWETISRLRLDCDLDVIPLPKLHLGRAEPTSAPVTDSVV